MTLRCYRAKQSLPPNIASQVSSSSDRHCSHTTEHRRQIHSDFSLQCARRDILAHRQLERAAGEGAQWQDLAMDDFRGSCVTAGGTLSHAA